MKNNPFTSSTYVSKWFSHFEKNQTEKKFSFINDISFYKHSWLPLFINSGKNLTKGVNYNLSENDNTDYKGNTYLIYDVPEFFNVKTDTNHQSLKIKKVKQYPGFLVELNSFKDITEYMNTTFKKSSRYKLRKYKNRFEQCFDISYKMYKGEMSKEEYDFVFDHFKRLLEKRFLDKEITNNNLNLEEWNFYYDVVYPMILEEKASLQVIYDGKKPIGVTLNYFSDTVLFDAITVFDIDYAKFHLGSITIMKLIEWSIDNKLEIFDFTKGYFDYKKRWATKEYNFEYHILYDNKSLKARTIAKSIELFFKTKQYLRDKKINDRLHKLSFLLKNNKNKPANTSSTFQFKEFTENYNEADLVKVNYNEDENHYLKNIIFDFLYLNTESLKDIELYKIANKQQLYLISGKTSKQIVELSD